MAGPSSSAGSERSRHRLAFSVKMREVCPPKDSSRSTLSKVESQPPAVWVRFLLPLPLPQKTPSSLSASQSRRKQPEALPWHHVSQEAQQSGVRQKPGRLPDAAFYLGRGGEVRKRVYLREPFAGDGPQDRRMWGCLTTGPGWRGGPSESLSHEAVK